MLLKPKKSTWAIVTFYSAADSVLDDVCAISKVYYVITHIPVKARRNIIPFLEHAVFLEAAIVNRWCNICVCGYTQLPPPSQIPISPDFCPSHQPKCHGGYNVIPTIHVTSTFHATLVI